MRTYTHTLHYITLHYGTLHDMTLGQKIQKIQETFSGTFSGAYGPARSSKSFNLTGRVAVQAGLLGWVAGQAGLPGWVTERLAGLIQEF